MKKEELVDIAFVFEDRKYLALVRKNTPTVILLPDQTVVQTTCAVHQSGAKRSKDKKFTRNIYTLHGELLPLKVLRKPEKNLLPLKIKGPVVFARLA